MNIHDIKQILDTDPETIDLDDFPADFPIYQSQCKTCNSPGRVLIDHLIASGAPDRVVGRYINKYSDFFAMKGKNGSALAVSIQNHRIKHTTTGRRPGANKLPKKVTETAKEIRLPQSEKIVASMTDIQRLDLVTSKALADVHAGIKTPSVGEGLKAQEQKRALLATSAQANIWSEMFKGQKLRNKKLEKELAPVIELDK